MRPVTVEPADSAKILIKKTLKASAVNGMMLKGFVRHACGDDDLLAWAEEVCSMGDLARSHLSYYEGRGAEAGESFNKQLERQLQDSFTAPDSKLREQGSELRSAEVARQALYRLLQQAMQLHESCAPNGGRDDLRWKIGIEVNQDCACTKYHDDNVEVRFAMTLAGEGTVLADNTAVDWDFYESCEGAIPALQKCADLTSEKAHHIIRTWNERISKGEVITGPGDLAIMKGGRLMKRPCLHRAPYCAGEGMKPARLLITIDHIPQDELQEFVDMELMVLGDESSYESEDNEDEHCHETCNEHGHCRTKREAGRRSGKRSDAQKKPAGGKTLKKKTSGNNLAVKKKPAGNKAQKHVSSKRQRKAAYIEETS